MSPALLIPLALLCVGYGFVVGLVAGRANMSRTSAERTTMLAEENRRLRDGFNELHGRRVVKVTWRGTSYDPEAVDRLHQRSQVGWVGVELGNGDGCEFTATQRVGAEMLADFLGLREVQGPVGSALYDKRFFGQWGNADLTVAASATNRRRFHEWQSEPFQ